MISVIVPAYNVETYVAKCLDSILSQDCSDLEVLVINDGSTDATVSEVERFVKRDARVRLISQKNGGLSRARNTGLDNAKGEYVLFIDGDDELPSGAIKRLVTAIEDQNADAAVGSIEVVYEAHHELKDSDTWYYTIRQKGTLEAEDALIDDFHCSACGVLFRRSIIEDNGLRFPNGLLFEDACWHWMYFTCCQKIAFVTEPAYRYWRHAQSIMSSTFEQKEGAAIQHLYVADKIFTFWLDRDELSAHRQTMLKLLEAFFWFAFRYSPDFEKPLAVYECAKIIRRFNLRVEDWDNLRRISEGDLSFLFPPKNNELSSSEQRNFARYLQIKSVIDRVLPRGSKRRRFVYLVARFGWKILSRLSGRSAT